MMDAEKKYFRPYRLPLELAIVTEAKVKTAYQEIEDMCISD